MENKIYIQILYNVHRMHSCNKLISHAQIDIPIGTVGTAFLTTKVDNAFRLYVDDNNAG